MIAAFAFGYRVSVLERRRQEWGSDLIHVEYLEGPKHERREWLDTCDVVRIKTDDPQTSILVWEDE